MSPRDSGRTPPAGGCPGAGGRWTALELLAPLARQDDAISADSYGGYLNCPNISGEDLPENDRVIVQRFTLQQARDRLANQPWHANACSQ